MALSIEKLGLNNQGRRVFRLTDQTRSVYWVAPPYIHLSCIETRIHIGLSFGRKTGGSWGHTYVFNTVEECLTRLLEQCEFMSRLDELHDIMVKRLWRTELSIHHVRGRPTKDGLGRISFYIPKYLQYRFKLKIRKDTPEGYQELRDYHQTILQYFQEHHRLAPEEAIRVYEHNPLDTST